MSRRSASAPSSSGTSLRSSCGSIASAAYTSCWSSRTPTWRCRLPTSAMCWKSAASSWRTPASGCCRKKTSRNSISASRTRACAASGGGRSARPGDSRQTATENAMDSLAMQDLDGRIEIEGCDTIAKLFWHQVKARDTRTAFREKDLGIWRATSWRQYGERVRWTGMGLVKLGLSHGEVVSILAETVPEWLYAQMGTMCAGGRSNGIYATEPAHK